MKTRHELDAALDALAGQMAVMIAENPDDANFWPAFAGAADEITDNVGEGDFEYVHRRLDKMLEEYGKHTTATPVTDP